MSAEITNGEKKSNFLEKTGNTIKDISEGISKFIKKSKPIAPTLPMALMVCSAIQRPGLSATLIASRIIARQESEGLAFGPMPDGTQNGWETMIKVFSEEFVKAIKNEARVDVTIPIGGLRSAGIAVTAQGSVPVNTFNVNNPKGVGSVS